MFVLNFRQIAAVRNDGDSEVFKRAENLKLSESVKFSGGNRQMSVNLSA